MAQTHLRATVGQRLAGAAVVLFVILGIADSLYLLDVHITHKLGKEVEGFCDLSERVNCLSAVDSSQSTLLGVPVPVWALAFYGGLLVLSAWATIRRRREDGLWPLIITLFLGGIVYSFYLLYILVFKLDAVCPGCLVLDAVNLLGLGLSFVAGGLGLVTLFRRFRDSLWSPTGLQVAAIFSLAFALVFVLSTAMARSQFQSRLAQASEQMAVSEEEFRNLVCGTELWSENGPAVSAPVAGNPEAPIVILDFSDFECPYCARLENTLSEILADRGDEIQVRFLHYPLNMDCNPNVGTRFHAQACLAAQASVCAHEQGQFWQLHDLLYANSRSLDRPNIDRMAASIGLDMARFRACIESEYSLSFVQANAVAGHRAMVEAGITEFGTPFFFVNGLPVRGARPRQVIESIIDTARQAISAQTAEEHALEGSGSPESLGSQPLQVTPASEPYPYQPRPAATDEGLPHSPGTTPARENPGRPSLD